MSLVSKQEKKEEGQAPIDQHRKYLKLYGTMSDASAYSSKHESSNLRSRLKAKEESSLGEEPIASIDRLEEEGKDYSSQNSLSNRILRFAVRVLGPIGLTVLSFYVRFNGIDRNNHVVWDEAHFGKFGGYYIKHTYYHDVHPPLGKMLIALSEWLAKFDGKFEFGSGQPYPEGVNFKFMRQFNATFGAMCTPLTFMTAMWMGFQMPTVYLITLMVALEQSYIVLSKFILLDSMLLFFTVATFGCMCKLYSMRKQQLTKKWSLWMLLTGISIGCVCSVKWVGLFVTIVVGLYTVLDLHRLYWDTELSRTKYAKHWLIRIIYLIAIPFLIYLSCFRIHFALLYKSGPGDATTNTLFQVNLQGNSIELGPRDVMYGSNFTMRSHGLSPNLLHSHIQNYPDGSYQKQITGYSHADTNNRWEFHFVRSSDDFQQYLSKGRSFKGTFVPITDGAEVRLIHQNTRCNLHSHRIQSHVSRGNYEVSGYLTDEDGDDNDNWIVEIVKQVDSSDPTYPKEDPAVVHPISTVFRLRHAELGCYLATTGMSYPQWGFSQAEIVCKYSWGSGDASTWWNIEDHWNDNLLPDDNYEPPKSNFWTDFIATNFAMAATNNALTIDPDKYDALASKPWEWPTLHRGLRMCTWSKDVTKYYLLGGPFNTWASSASLIIFLLLTFRFVSQIRRQTRSITEEQFWRLTIQGVFPFLGWLVHFVPFMIMGRVTYVHHYIPALYFAILVFGFVIDYTFGNTRKFIKIPVYLALTGGCIYYYILFSPLCQGMDGPSTKFIRLQWLNGWHIAL